MNSLELIMRSFRKTNVRHRMKPTVFGLITKKHLVFCLTYKTLTIFYTLKKRLIYLEIKLLLMLFLKNPTVVRPKYIIGE